LGDRSKFVNNTSKQIQNIMKTIINFNLIVLLFVATSLNFSCKKEDEPCVKKTWYLDADSDGLGDKDKPYEACERPVGYVDNASDDNDNPKKSLIPTKGYSTPTSYANLKLIWSDEFEGTSLNETFWNYEIGNNNGWGNNELQYYKKENTSVKDGYLIIQAKQESAGNQSYTSSRLTTQNKFNFKYGRVDIRAALPRGQGIWPALWMLGKNIPQVSWPKCGEIDIMEMIGGNGTSAGNDNTVYGTVHWDNSGQYAQYGGNTKLNSGTFNDEFHVFSIVWDAKKIVWYLDDKQFHVIDTTPAGLSEFQEEYFLLVNLAVGGNWPGKPDGTTVFPQQFVVDYIRVFQ
jgi:beta-glucanase (GH16 family)